MKSVKLFSRDAMTKENRGSFIYIFIDTTLKYNNLIYFFILFSFKKNVQN